jgi:hypothetical protein
MSGQAPKSALPDYEKLGIFYLGRRIPAPGGQPAEPVLYDARDLTTHAVCVGMTGSGKTGLCVSLLEEAALDGIPVIAIDPKGDLANLALTFPDLAPADFRPWIDESEARRKGRSPDEQARAVAETWRKGLAESGQDAERIRRLRAAARVVVYTPGSEAGRPLALLGSLAAPAPEIAADAEALRERIASAVSGLLGLAGITTDPLRSREHILLATILDRAWSAGQSLDLAGLIRAVQDPGIERVGVFDLESFFAASDRFELAMTLNNLLAAPGFGAWMQGDALETGSLLFDADGRPRVSVLSIAHLSDAERMFVVTAVLAELISWMRAQPGTSSLRALLYMDEVMGYLPPTANPPSKTPLLTLLKQARAFGVGVVLATQNPVDLDYKALSNAGTWFLGRLQTERDKARVLDGLEGAATGAPFNRAEVDRILSSLGARNFLVHNVHDDAPVLMTTRWAMSYLAGPMTREQIRRLREREEAAVPSPDRPQAPFAGAQSAATSMREAAAVACAPDDGASFEERPLPPPGVDEVFLVGAEVSGSAGLRYRPALLGTAMLHWSDARRGVDLWRRVNLLAALDGAGADPWRDARALGPSVTPQPEPVPGASFAQEARLPDAAAIRTWTKMLVSALYRDQALTLWECAQPKACSRPGQSRSEFLAELALAAREARDLEVEKLRRHYAPRLERLADAIRRAEDRVDVEQDQLAQSKQNTAISLGATVLGALFGRKLASYGTVGRAGTAMRSAARVRKEKGDVERARERADAAREKLAALEEELQERLSAIVADNAEPELRSRTVAPRKSDIQVERVALAWIA